WGARSVHVLQCAGLAPRRLAGRRGRDLHVLQRGLHRQLPAGPGGLLPAPQVQAERAPAVQAARVHEIRGAGIGPLLRRRLALRRTSLLQAGERADLLLPRLARAALVPAVLLVPDAGGGSQVRRSGEGTTG